MANRHTQVSLRGMVSASVLVAALLTEGCTTVRIYNAGVAETRHFGFVVLEVVPAPTSASVVVTRSLGLTIGINAGTLGYLNETAFIASEAGSCRSMIIVEDLVELNRLAELLTKQPLLANLCVVTPKGVAL
jgi:hypothetical protein